ncbi:MAG: class I SAM-dependent methyltransferase [Candidatus Hodarchaeota archaeon]
MDRYYSDRLSAQRLQRCYEIAPDRTKQYLEAEIRHVVNRIREKDAVLELGCGYGRLLERLVESCRSLVGIDTSMASLKMAKNHLCPRIEFHLLQTNASTLPFQDSCFDVVVCVQNGISAFKLEPIDLMKESIRVTRSGGQCIFSSYSHKFWEARLEWFRLQSEEGLLGEIDWNQTVNGVIVCKDGFRATTFGEDDFMQLVAQLDATAQLIEVDESSLFCEIRV